MRTIHRTTLGLYRDDLPWGLLCDKYALTMGQAAFKAGIHNEEVVFHGCFRRHLFNGAGYSIAGGMDYVAEFLQRLSFTDQSIDYLASQHGNDGKPIYTDDWLGFLQTSRFTGDIDAMRDGTVVGGHAPIIRYRGPFWLGLLVEAGNLLFQNRQTAVMTRAARVVTAAGGDPVSNQALRRSSGVDGALSDDLATYKAGFASTSNELAGWALGIPTAGTMAHAFVMFLEDEVEAFLKFAEAFPNNSLFLVDTYDTIEGIKRAIQVGLELKRRGYNALGIRLDSGDLAYLSIEARKMLDAAGLQHMKVFGSGGLDEKLIESIKAEGGKIVCWGVGENIPGTPPLSGVWKIGAKRRKDGTWKRLCKLAEGLGKVTLPGILGVKRFFRPDDTFMADCIYDVEKGLPEGEFILWDPEDEARQKKIPAGTPSEDLLVPMFRGGELVTPIPSLDEVRSHTAKQLAGLSAHNKRLVNGHRYPVGIAPDVYGLRKYHIMKGKRLQLPPVVVED